MCSDREPEGAAQDLVREALLRARADSRSRDPGRSQPRVSKAPRPSAPTGSPQPVGGLLREWVSDRGADVDVALARVLSCWGEVVGAEVAGHSRAERIDAGVLHVVAESTAWATQLRLLGPQLLERVRAEVAQIAGAQAGVELVREVRITGPRGPSWKKGRLSVPGRGPRDTYG